MANANFSISQYGRAVCPVCGDEFALTKAGVLRHHDNKNLPRNLPTGRLCAGAYKDPGQVAVAAASAVHEPKPAPSFEERRRRLKADAEDARKTLNRAQRHYDSLRDELAALRRGEMEADRG